MKREKTLRDDFGYPAMDWFGPWVRVHGDDQPPVGRKG